MIYAVHKFSKRHRIVEPDAKGKYRASMDERLVQATPDGWIEWQGGECPLTESHLCDIRSRNGVMRFNIPAGVHLGGPIPDAGPAFWDYYGIGEDIIAYRPILDADAKPEPPTWDGKGLPPVGCECEWRAGANEWKKGYIIAKWGDRIWLATGDELKEQVWNVAVVDFRPIRSEEYRAVEEMVDIWSNTPSLNAADGMRALYRAGYRKTGDEG